jgi:hypothetical protein
MTAPLGSTTVPLMVPVMTDCAFAVEVNASAARSKAPIQPGTEALPGVLCRADRLIVPIADVMSILPPQVSRCPALVSAVEFALFPDRTAQNGPAQN